VPSNERKENKEEAHEAGFLPFCSIPFAAMAMGGGGLLSPMTTKGPNQTADSFNSMMPTGLKGKLASLEDFISMQNEELAAQRQEIESLRNDKQNIEQHYQAQLQELKKTMVADVQRMQDEVKRHFAQQKADNSRLQQQITTLKGEKTSLQQQILGLQRRIQEIEEQVGAD
jgi:DNA repair exonuclease SbcCD ATPase subunit